MEGDGLWTGQSVVHPKVYIQLYHPIVSTALEVFTVISQNSPLCTHLNSIIFRKPSSSTGWISGWVDWRCPAKKTALATMNFHLEMSRTPSSHLQVCQLRSRWHQICWQTQERNVKEKKANHRTNRMKQPGTTAFSIFFLSGQLKFPSLLEFGYESHP